jgi:hypothetical protein
MTDPHADPDEPETGSLVTPSLPAEITPTPTAENEVDRLMEDFQVPGAPDVSLPEGDIGHRAVDATAMLGLLYLPLSCLAAVFPPLRLIGLVGCWVALRRMHQLTRVREELGCGGLIFFLWSLLCYVGMLSLSVLLLLAFLRDLKIR